MLEAASAWTNRMFSSPGTPKTTATPSFSRHSTIARAAVFTIATIAARRDRDRPSIGGVPNYPEAWDDESDLSRVVIGHSGDTTDRDQGAY
jgi:hypothetical protein